MVDGRLQRAACGLGIQWADAVAEEQPAVTDRWCVALMSTPTAILSGWACMCEPNEARVSASTQEAPPCQSPYGCVLPATGISAYSTGMSGQSSVEVTGLRLDAAYVSARS